MRHLKSGRKLNRTSSHRKAMFANLATSLLDKERVTTTVAKAKEARGIVERLITYGKKGDLHAVRLAARTIADKDVLKKLFDDIAPSYKERNGGYTRVLKLGERRGDNAELALLELVGRRGEEPRKKSKKKKTAKKKVTKKAPDSAQGETPVAEVEVAPVEVVAPAPAEEAQDAAAQEEKAAPQKKAAEKTDAEEKKEEMKEEKPETAKRKAAPKKKDEEEKAE